MIPVYRAKKIDKDEYVEGFYVDTVDFFTKTLKNANGYITKDGNFHIVDISTLSIHFPDMLDSNGNKIFASLSKNEKGGDIVSHKDDNHSNFGLSYSKGAIRRFFPFSGNFIQVSEFSYLEVIGIQE